MAVFKPTRVLITVLTYPHPSDKYDELVCTAGITSKGEWVRLYPIDYRYLSEEKQFRKYQWIEVGLAKEGHRGDKRKESRRPDRNSIRILEPRLSTKNGWADRRMIVDSMPVHTLSQLRKMYERDRTSLGVVRPKRVLDLEIVEEKETWKPGQEAVLNQLRLFGEGKPLRKIPYRFRYVFKCEDSQKTHTASITDWEAGVLWLNEVERLGNERDAAESVREKFLNEICREDRDTRFFMGTILPYNTWLVFGVFWPPKSWQPT